MPINSYTFEEVEKILTDKRDLSEIAKEMERTQGALNVVRWQARQFQNGNPQAVSRVMRGHFQRFYTNRGNMQLEEKTVSQDHVTDTCNTQLETLIGNAAQTFELLQQQMRDIAKLSAEHQVHAVHAELETLRAWKKENEPELARLKEFYERAKKGNFASMVRNAIPF